MKSKLIRYPLTNFSRTQVLFFVWFFSILGLAARISLVFSSTNFDFESYKITASLVLDGTPPWQSQRYNYGITWSLILSSLQLASFSNDFIFRLLIIIVLSIADIVISLTLKRWFGYKAALIFFLNPISILITGHYNQFDNLSIAVGMLALNSLIDFEKNGTFKHLVHAILLFSLSLTIKHNLVLFLLWFIFSNFSKRVKLSLIAIPYSLFLLHFIPFMLQSSKDKNSIMSAVFKYWSSNNAPFWKFWFWNKDFAESLGDHTAWHHGRLWILLMTSALLVVGFYSRRRSLKEQLAIYTLALVIFSSALVDQFLAIAALGASVYFSVGFFIFFIFSFFYLLTAPAGLALIQGKDSLLLQSTFIKIVPWLLLLGLLTNLKSLRFETVDEAD